MGWGFSFILSTSRSPGGLTVDVVTRIDKDLRATLKKVTGDFAKEYPSKKPVVKEDAYVFLSGAGRDVLFEYSASVTLRKLDMASVEFLPILTKIAQANNVKLEYQG
jgi:hypothetical protein